MPSIAAVQPVHVATYIEQLGRRDDEPLSAPYADLLAAMQGVPPEYMYVVAPWSEFQPQQYRLVPRGCL